MASTRRIRAGLARAFGASEEELFDYLEGGTTLAEFSRLRNRLRRPASRDDERKSAREQAIEVIVADGYGSASEVRQAAARAREGLPREKQASLGVLEWANLIETTLRQLRRSGDPASSSGINPTARAPWPPRPTERTAHRMTISGGLESPRRPPPSIRAHGTSV